MSRNRARNFLSKQSSISTIPSHVSLMKTSKSDKTYPLTQSLMNTNAKADVHSVSQPFPTNSNREFKRSRTICQPKGTIPYTVGNTDTLEKIALRSNSTPSELLQLNKLNSRMIFPGQILFVPEEHPSDNADQQQSTTSPTISPSKPKDDEGFILLPDRRSSSEPSPPPLPSLHHQSQKDVGPVVWSITRPITAVPGHARRLKSDPDIESEPSRRAIEEHSSTQKEDNSQQVKTLQRSLSIDENHPLDEECLQRFIKVNVRLMTEDRQGVAGTLLVTPNAVMFDPDVLDPLIKEHGIDKYGLIIRMDLLAGIALYEDLAMYEHEATARDEEKRKMCHSTSVRNSQHSQTNIPLNTDEEQIHDLMNSLLDKIDKELNPSPSTNTCMLFNASSTFQRNLSKNSPNNNNFDDKTFLPIPTNDIDFDDSFQPFDDYKHSIGILLNDNENENINKNFNQVPPQISYVFDWTRFKRAKRIKKGCHLENCVPVDEFNKRFSEIDKLLYQQQKSYSAPHPIVIPYYLCIKTSMHIHDVPSLYPKQYKKPSERNFDNVYGEKQLEYEYWFAVPKEKIDHLYSFFLRWTPERELNPLIDDDDDENQPPNIDPSKPQDKSINKGFVLLATNDPEFTDEYSTTKISKNQRKKNDKQENIHYLNRQNTLLKEWEIMRLIRLFILHKPK